MATRYAGLDLSLATVGGVALASAGYTVDLLVENDGQDAGLITRLGKNTQPVKQSGTLTVSLNSILSGSDRVSHLNVSAFTIGGTSYLNVLKSYNLSGSFDHEMQAGIGEKYAKPQVVAKDYAINASLNVENTDSFTLLGLMGGSDFSNIDQVVSATINSVAITVPMNIQSVGLALNRAALQELALSFVGADPGTGDYPTAPTGTTTILEKALNSATSEFAFAFQNVLSGNTNGVNVSGNCVFDSFTVETSDGNLVSETYTFKTYGTITTAASS